MMDDESQDVVVPGKDCVQKENLIWMQAYTTEDVRKQQETEEWYPKIQDVVGKQLSGKDVNFMSMSPAERTLFGMRQHLFLENGILYRRWKITLGLERVQLIV